MSTQKGFTLIELLIVIAVLAVLSTAVVLVLNPAEILKQGRDSTRLSDLDTINRAIALYLSDVSTTTWVTTDYCTGVGTSLPGGGTCTSNAVTAVNGTGWIPVNLTAISVGSPLSRLPLDPVNDSASTACAGTLTGCFYAYEADATMGNYKLYTNLESQKYATKESADGGTVADWYETGRTLSL